MKQEKLGVNLLNLLCKLSLNCIKLRGVDLPWIDK